MKYLYQFILATFFFTACQQKSEPIKESVQETKAESFQNKISTGPLEKVTLTQNVACTGEIDVPPMERTIVHSYIEAIVTYIGVIPGENVQKGQVLVKLKHPNLIKLQQGLLEKLVERDFYAEELLRKQDLDDSGAISAKDINDTRRAFEQSEIQVTTLTKELNLLGISAEDIQQNGIKNEVVIRAPFDGSISDVNVSNGEFVSSHDEILEIVGNDHKHLELNVFANQTASLKIGQSITYNIPGQQKKYKGNICLINPAIKDNILRVHGHLEDEDSPLKVGTFIEAEIITESIEAWAVPADELIRNGDQYYLFQPEGNGYVKVEVQIGKRNADYVEVLNTDSDEVWVTKGNYYLQEY